MSEEVKITSVPDWSKVPKDPREQMKWVFSEAKKQEDEWRHSYLVNELFGSQKTIKP